MWLILEQILEGPECERVGLRLKVNGRPRCTPIAASDGNNVKLKKCYPGGSNPGSSAYGQGELPSELMVHSWTYPLPLHYILKTRGFSIWTVASPVSCVRVLLKTFFVLLFFFLSTHNRLVSFVVPYASSSNIISIAMTQSCKNSILLKHHLI